MGKSFPEGYEKSSFCFCETETHNTMKTSHSLLDEYCCKRGKKVGKAKRLREVDIIKYVKIKEEPSASPAPSIVIDAL